VCNMPGRNWGPIRRDVGWAVTRASPVIRMPLWGRW
jgi:hypothetical protein